VGDGGVDVGVGVGCVCIDFDELASVVVGCKDVV